VLVSMRAERRRAAPYHHSYTELPRVESSTKISSAASLKCLHAGNTCIRSYFTMSNQTRWKSTTNSSVTGTRRWLPSPRTRYTLLAVGGLRWVIATHSVSIPAGSSYVRAMLTAIPVHIWEYQRYEGYHQSLHNIQSHPEFAAFDAKLKSLIRSKHTSLMQEFSFWPTTPPRQLGGLFELRSYTLHPGNLLEWETHWRRGLKARREVMEGVGAWFVQIGELNTVHHLWQFANLEERKVRREQSWNVEGWGETVHKTVPLIQTMKSRILVPCAWSTVA
jgi:hypothetical protein